MPPSLFNLILLNFISRAHIRVRRRRRARAGLQTLCRRRHRRKAIERRGFDAAGAVGAASGRPRTEVPVERATAETIRFL